MFEFSLFYLLIISIGNVLALTYGLDTGRVSWFSPTNLYENTEMNWFGCWCCAIMITLVAPILAILIFIDYIFHICRNE